MNVPIIKEAKAVIDGLTQSERESLSEILAMCTGYEKFKHGSGISGLAKGFGGVTARLDVLALSASRLRRGQFRKFITSCKGAFTEIAIWEVWNDWLPTVLQRYGFEPVTEIHDGEKLDGWIWRKK